MPAIFKQKADWQIKAMPGSACNHDFMDELL